jgi:hypothetical protein
VIFDRFSDHQVSFFMPTVFLNIHIESAMFLDRFAKIADAEGTMEVNRTEGGLGLLRSHDSESDVDKIALMPTSARENAVEAVIFSPLESEAQANRQRAKELLKTLGSRYNAKFNDSCRLSTVSDPKPYDMPPATKERFDSFCATPSLDGALPIRSLHPNDWTRFYKFVRFCHAHNVSLTQDRLYQILKERGFEDEMASKLKEVYYRGRHVLKGKWSQSF